MTALRRIALPTVALAAAAALAACQPQAPNGAPAPAPADAPVDASRGAVAPLPATTTQPEIANDFERDLNLTGTEPFWAVRIRPQEMTLMRPDHPDMTIPKPDPTVEDGRAVWRGSAFTVRLAAQGDCSDGMSDRVYPFTAQIEINGEVMNGCGARADEVFAPS